MSPVLAAIALSTLLQAQPVDHAREEYAYSTGIQAYIYGLPPVIFELTRQQMAPPPRRNHFAHATKLATHLSRAVVAPNNDTLYSIALLDLAPAPLLLHLPPIHRYHTLQFIDAYTNNFAYLGTRITGARGGDFLIHGPAWRGKAPPGVRLIAAPSNTVWIIARFLVNGPGDIPNVAVFQKQLTLRPLNAAVPGEALSIPERGKPVVPVVNAMNPREFFGSLAGVMTGNPPPARDQAMVRQFEHIGIKPGSPFAYDHLDPATQRGLSRALEAGREILSSLTVDRTGARRNGWNFPDASPWQADYLRRADIALRGLGAMDPQEAIYATTKQDFNGAALTGEKHYRLRFGPGQLPPVSAFWSVTMYDQDHFLIENPIARYAIGDRTQGLKYEPDGALLIYIQHDRSVGHEANWLPAPAGPFNLSLRLYLPKPAVVNGTWLPPKVQSVE